MKPARLSAYLFLLALLVSPVAAQDRSPKIDDVNGRSTANYPPSPQADFQHMKLEIRMPDPKSKGFDASETLSFKTLSLPLERLRLDAVGLDITGVKDSDGRTLEFRHDGNQLIVQFPEPVSPNTEKTLIFEYACKEPRTGLIFAVPDEAYPNRPLHIHSQGQPEDNRHWFISHDHPNERMTTEIIATVPAELKVLSNGEFVGEEDAADGLKRWHYKMSKPHVSYLVSLVIGEFDVVEDEPWRGKRVSYWVPPGQAEGVQRTFSKTKNMLDFFSDKVGDYPWEAYSQSCVYLFNSGGMENTTVTTLYEDAVLDSDKAAEGNSIDGLIAHELAHQWWGDHTTCKSWAHIWLNEGFATYMEQAWQEHYFGTDEYAHRVYTNMRGVAASDDVTAEGGLYNPYWKQPWDVFGRAVSNPYGKGAAVIHMLRQYTGNDEVFWEALRLFQERHALSAVEADELRMCFEEVTGRDYEQFFRQWVYRPGAPKFRVDYNWNDEAKAVELNFVQTQPVAAEYPAFNGPMDIWCVMDGGEVRKFTADISGRTSRAQFSTGEQPQQVVLNPTNGMLCVMEIDLPLEMTVAQAATGPTPFARLAAIDRLGSRGDDQARRLLAGILGDEQRHWGQRDEAAGALGRMNSPAARDALLSALADGIEHPRVRQAAVNALGEYRDEKVAAALIPFARQDKSLMVEVAACGALGKQVPTDEIMSVLVEKSTDTSWANRVRQSAVGALAALGDERGIEPAMKLAAYGGPFRARGTGIDALGRLYQTASKERQKEIREFLLALVNDPQERNAMSAIRALGATGDREAVAGLQRVSSSGAPEAYREAAREAVRQIEERDQSAVIRELRERLETLEQRMEAQQLEERAYRRAG